MPAPPNATPRAGQPCNAKELDETGLYYYGARYYNPRSGIWMSPDPILDGHFKDTIGGPWHL